MQILFLAASRLGLKLLRLGLFGPLRLTKHIDGLLRGSTRDNPRQPELAGYPCSGAPIGATRCDATVVGV